MDIGLIDVDSHNFPNLCLMKISAWHKAQGDNVEWCNLFQHYDKVYMSRVFDDKYTKDFDTVINADEIIQGGTGYGLDNKLSDSIEHMYPDYGLYPRLTKNTAYGFLTRGCPNACPFCIVSDKEGRKSVKVADLSEFWRGQKEIKLLDPNLLACKEHKGLLQQLIDSKAKIDFTQGLDARLVNNCNIDLLVKIKVKMIHFAFDLMDNEKAIVRGLRLYKEATGFNRRNTGVYVLTNYNTTHEEDLYRIYKCIELGYNPFVMVFNKSSAPKITKQLQRWCNNRIIFESTNRDFGKYNCGADMGGAEHEPEASKAWNRRAGK